MVKFNLNDFKYIISSGCSYGLMGESISIPINYGTEYDRKKFNQMDVLKKMEIKSHYESESDVIIIDLSVASQSSEYIMISTIQAVSSLIGAGIKKENIYCFVEWTESQRISLHPFDWINSKIYTELDFDKLQGHTIKILSNKNINEGLVNNTVRNILPFYVSKKYYNVPKIESRIFLNPTHTPSDKSNFYVNEFKKYGDEIELKIPIEDKINRYLSNILNLQNYLKLNDIKYNFCFMQGTLTGWERDTNDFLFHDVEFKKNPRFKFVNNRLIKNLKFKSFKQENTDIEKVAPFCKIYFDQLDFKNIWLYNSKNYRRGGFDEWSFDNFGDTCMISPDDVMLYHQTKKINIENSQSNFGYHPNTNLFKLLWNEISTNCDFFKINDKFKNKLIDMYWEDYNSESTVNLITLSKNIYNNFVDIKSI
jgi:hypothetical protein